MATLTWKGRAIACGEGSVLDALLAAGETVPSSCRAGACQTCLLRAVDGVVPAEAQRGLREALVAQGYFLACQARPAGDLTLVPADDLPTVEATVLRVERPHPSVVRLYLQPDESFRWRAGQFVHVVRDEGLSRPYSIASATGSAAIELHVKRLPHGAMSSFLCGEVVPGARLRVRGPSGVCVYDPSTRDRPLVLAGAGTGLAPLLGVLRDALAANHQGPIELHHGAVEASGLYADDELRALAAGAPALRYLPSVLQGPTDDPRVGPLRAKVSAALRAHKGARVYLCGAPETIRPLQRDAFLAGVRLDDLFVDPFVTAVAR